jgi:SAM-dependent methyltransferase
LNKERPSLKGPSLPRSASNYQHLAQDYDRRMSIADRIREEAIATLELEPDAVVLDIGCGTGSSFSSLIDRGVGEIIAIEPSLEMYSQALERVQKARWNNVTLIQGAVEACEIPEVADAALFSLTHDILRSPAAIYSVLCSLHPGASVVIGGTKFLPWYRPITNLYLWLKARRYVTTFEGYRRPWDLIEPSLDDFEVKTLLLGAGYVASGRCARRLRLPGDV